MTTFYIVRHGEYENPAYIYPGRTPNGFPLTAHGREEIQRWCPYFADKQIAAIYSSPLVRTRESAEIFSAALNLSVIERECLTELKTNAEGISMTVFDETNGEYSYLPEQIKVGAESIEEAGERIYRCAEEIRKTHVGNRVLLVSHGDPIRFLLMKYLNWPMEFATSRKIEMPLAAGFRLDIGENGASMAALPMPR